VSEWTILDSYGTPYGGDENNYSMPIRLGGSGYEDPDRYWTITYGDELNAIGKLGRWHFGGPA